MRAIRNTHSPINRLPPEVLSRIFEHRGRERDLVAATHVCQYWRSTLISSPSLWTTFQLGSNHDVGRTLAYLERSKSATINIKITMNSLQELEALHHLAPHIHRTSSFAIRGSLGVHVASSLLLCSPAPNLKRLEMYARDGSVRNLDNFLGRQAPSLRFVSFNGIFPVPESPFTIPNLTELTLHLPVGAGPFRISSLIRFCVNCPRLQTIRANISSEIFRDAGSDEITSLESLVELDFTSVTVGRVLPYLKLPRLKRLTVTSSLQAGKTNKFTDFLPHGGRALLAGATKMFFFSDPDSQRVDLSGEGTEASFTVMGTVLGPAPVDWFSNEGYIPFERIGDLTVQCCHAPTNTPINLFKNLTILRMASLDAQFTEGCLRMLYPRPGAGVPCPSLRRMEHTLWTPTQSLMRPLISLVKARESVGHRVELVCITTDLEIDQDLEDELREHVGELRISSLVGGL